MQLFLLICILTLAKWSWHKLCAWYFFLFLIDKAYHPYIYICESALVVSASVLWCSGRAVQTVECLVTWRLDSTAVLAAFRAGDPVRLEN